MTRAATPRVSVIMPTHSRPEFLRRAVASVLAQTYGELEVLVVDDAGTDPTPVLATFGDPRIRLIRHAQNRGLAGARNTGLRAARGEFIAYCDDDDYFHAGHCAHLVGRLDATRAAMVYADAWATEERWKDGVPEALRRTLVYSRDFDRRRLLCDNLLPVTTAMHRRTLLSVTDGFDEQLRVHEDWEHWLRVAESGATVLHDAVITSEYTTRPGTGNMRTQWHAKFLETFQVIHLRHRAGAEALGVTAAQAEVRRRCAEFSRRQLATMPTADVAGVARTGLLRRLAHGAARLGDTADVPAVHALLDEAAAKAPADADVWVAVAAAARLSGRWRHALDALAEASRLGDPVALHAELAVLCVDLGHHDDARRHAEVYRQRTGHRPARIDAPVARVGAGIGDAQRAKAS